MKTPLPRLSVALALLALSAAGSPNPSFNIVNRLAQPVREIFVTPAGNANWGQNRLDGRQGHPSSLAPGASFTVRRAADNNCIFDIKVVLADGKSEERKGVNTCARDDVAIGGPAASPAMNTSTGKAGDDPSVKLFNRAAVPLVEFYAVPSGVTDWGANRLDKAALAPDQSRAIALPREGNCIFDLRVVFADHRAREKKRSNLCMVSELPVP